MRVISLAVALTLGVALSVAAQDMSAPGHHDPSAIDGWRDHGHAQNHDWYKNLKQPGTGYSCCNGDTVDGDCRPTRAYKDSDGTWRALVDGHWQPVPPSVVLKTLAPDGNSHVCAGKSGMIYCFIGGVPKS
ncbi:hypothetical protein SAMN02745126_05689 [Enhydrobacter aerosaccus]|uniref:Uncharacterized protein n=1 Tax=Enhydrobacter aerosaccus TaxID=225324 RepID=A0A1T4T4Y6_9HYPH|nr:hypothetical protein [Enhydrobacter aerosaccus]SKA35590.1 hypothetical protein SAMN02745126_05689 [Enhydrobacter aerosaccus]